MTNEKKVVNDKKPGSMPGKNYEKFFCLNLFLWRLSIGDAEKRIPQRIKVPAFKQSYHTGQNEKKKTKNIMVQLPFSKLIKTNIGRTFLNLLEKHFSSRHRLRKICNQTM